LTQFSQVNH